MTTDELLPQLQNVRRASGGYSALCPAHEDRNNSLTITSGDDGRILLHCHAGCSTEAVVNKLALTMRDLMARNGNGRQHGSAKIVATYDYHDESGTLLYQVVRYNPKDFRQRRPKDGGGWEWSVKDVRHVPYRLPELLTADPARMVIIVEGEKDVDRLMKEKLVATCNAGGAGKWRPEYNQYFAGRHMVILQDNDEAGRKHAQQIAMALHGVAASVKVLELPNLPEKGDVSDWLAAGGTVEELTRLVEVTPEWTPPDMPVTTHTFDDFPLTDTGLAERFALQHGDNLRYCFAWGKWLAWDGTRWKIDGGGAVDQLGKQTVRSILRKAADEPDDARRKALSAFAKSSEAVGKREAMVKLARSEPPIPITPDVLDKNAWILNCPNGKLDLRTGQLCEHQREDYITKLCPVEYHSDAICPTWLVTLDTCLGRNYELIDFVQRFAGYCLTGDVSEQIMNIWHGIGQRR